MIYGEVLQGTVDSINTVFTCQHNISSVQDIFLGGLSLSPSLYTVDGRRIIFNTPIPIWQDNPIIDYFEAEDYTRTSNYTEVTLLNIINNIYDVIGRSDTSTIFKKNTLIKKVNECLLKVGNSLRPDNLNSSYSFTIAETISSTSGYRGDRIDVNSAIDNFFPRTGKILVGNTIVNFLSRTDISFNIGEALRFKNDYGFIINAGYKLPQDVLSITRVIVDGIEVNSIKYEEVTTDTLLRNNYFIKDGYLFFIGEFPKEAMVKINYKKVNGVLTNDADIIPIPYEYSSVLEDYASFFVLQNREDDRWQIIEKRYKETLREYKSYLQRHSKGKHYIGFHGPINKI